MRNLSPQIDTLFSQGADMKRKPHEPYGERELLEVSIERLRPGVHVVLPGSWLDHPFLFNAFTIKSEHQIALLREAGIASVMCDLSRSRCQPEPAIVKPESAEPQDGLTRAESSQAEQSARIQSAAVRLLREDFARADLFLRDCAARARQLFDCVHADPSQSLKLAKELVHELLDQIGGRSSQLLCMMHINRRSGLQHHAVEVALVAITLANATGANPRAIQEIGLGALLHDIGKLHIPASVLHAPSVSRAAQGLYREHAAFGHKTLKQAGVTNPNVLDIVLHHHEHADGSGFPHRLKQPDIRSGTRVVAIANRFAGLCARQHRTPRSPSEAVAQMALREAHLWDAELLRLFVRQFGVYPPGSLVELSDKRVGLVIEATESPTRPKILVPNSDLQSNSALVVSLQHMGDIEIARAIRPDSTNHSIIQALVPCAR